VYLKNVKKLAGRIIYCDGESKEMAEPAGLARGTVWNYSFI